MQSELSDINDLLLMLEASDDPALSGGGQSKLRDLGTFPAALVVLEGRDVVFTEDFGLKTDKGRIRRFTRSLIAASERGSDPEFTVSMPSDNGSAFGVRLPTRSGSLVAGLLHAEQCDTLPGLRDDVPLRALCLTLVRAVVEGRSREEELRTRVSHLQAEHEMLKDSQAHAVADAIDEREKRLQQQRNDLEQMEAMMRFAADGMMTVSEQGIIESFNEAAAKIFGYEPSEVIGKDVSILAPSAGDPHRGARLVDIVRRRSTDAFGQLKETVGRRKNGHVFPLEIGISEVPLETGYVVSAIFRDIENRKRCESQLVQAQKMESIGQLAAGIAHEINTPTQFVGDNTRFLGDVFRDLTPLLSHCRGLCEADLEDESLGQSVAELIALAKEADLDYLISEIPQAIAQSLEGVERVAKIVRSMKEFSHPKGETKQAVDLNRALESTLTVCRNEWKYVADVVTDFDPELPLVACIPGECNQVFLNLIINAAHAIGDTLGEKPDKTGNIFVSTRRDGDWVEIRIGDNGSGIPEAYRSRIFDPFFTTKEVGRGTGQGLAIAHGVITKKHSGTIGFETEVGKGTTFIIRLPVSGSRDEAEKQP